MLQRYHYDIYHTSDFHGALAPLYLLPYTMPLVLTLHNAEYQGNYPLVDHAQTKRLQCIFNLPKEVCQEYSWCVQANSAVITLLHSTAQRHGIGIECWRR